MLSPKLFLCSYFYLTIPTAAEVASKSNDDALAASSISKKMLSFFNEFFLQTTAISTYI